MQPFGVLRGITYKGSQKRGVKHGIKKWSNLNFMEWETTAKVSSAMAQQDREGDRLG